jgi:DNA-binding transcriptional MerR regulator/quercetin dioxygenase-like cupin family protein
VPVLKSADACCEIQKIGTINLIKTGRVSGSRRCRQNPDENSMEKNSTARQDHKQLLRFLTVGQTARILGISPSTLRLWESVGLVSPARSSGRFRLYTPELLEVLKRIKYLHDVKRLNVPGIKEAMAQSLPAKANTDGRKIPDFGPRLRKLRKRQGLSLAEAAERAGVSAGFLSSVELSHSKPSVSTLSRLAGAYGTTVLELYDIPKKPDRIVRPDKRQSIQTQSGVRMELLSTGTKMLETMLMRVPPATGSDGAYTHQGEDWMYMLRGELEIWLDEAECYVLHENESFWFESNRGHRWYNPGKKEAVIIWVNTPPTF